MILHIHDLAKEMAKSIKAIFNNLLRRVGLYPPPATAQRFLQAIEHNDVAEVKSILSQHPTATRWQLSGRQPGDTPDISIFKAIEKNALGVVDALLTHDPGLIVARDASPDKNSVLHHGAATSRDMTHLLIYYQADINSRNKTGATPMMWAKSDDEALFILKKNPDLHVSDVYGNDAVFYLSRRGLARSVDKILSDDTAGTLRNRIDPALAVVVERMALFTHNENSIFETAAILMRHRKGPSFQSPHLVNAIKRSRVEGHTELAEQLSKSLSCRHPTNRWRKSNNI